MGGVERYIPNNGDLAEIEQDRPGGAKSSSMLSGGHSDGCHHAFCTTQWSLVLTAKDAQSPAAKEALERLCRAYWYPLYAYVRRKGYQSHDADELTQEFFAQLLARNYLSVADRNRGRFRSFLLGSLEHFLAREWTKGHAQKRGGGHAAFPLDGTDAETRYLLEPSHELTPEKIFDRRWATTLLDLALSQLRRECNDGGKGNLFAQVETLLSGRKGEASYAEIALVLNTSEGAIKVAVHRLRQRYGELVRSQIAQTVATPEEIGEELDYLFRAVCS
jgi:DNA-directed RNA polymerase specialized sigma24 family protein